MKHIITTHWVRIDRRTARKLYKTQPTRLHFCPVNLNPESPWGLLYWPGNNELPFDSLVNEYTAYNCTGNETGRYPAFYVSRQWWDLVHAAAAEFAPDGPAHAALESWEVNNP